MPSISRFYGITITMYWDERGHPVPHFHAEYAGERASITLGGAVLGGSLPKGALRLVRAWAELHRDELLVNWKNARAARPLAPIDPLS